MKQIYRLLLFVFLFVAGFVPFAGAIPDGVNTAISAVRGNWVDAGANFVAIFPGPGDALKGTKMAKEAIEQGVKHADEVKGVKQGIKSGNLEKLKKHQLKNISEHKFKEEVLGGTKDISKYNISIDKKTKELFLTPVKKGALPNIETRYWLGPNGPTTIKPK